MSDVMLDLETLGTSARAAILSIGAVAFDPNGCLPERIVGNDGLSYNVDLQSCLDIGLEVDGSTFYWWLQQSDNARKALYDPEPIPIKEALQRLTEFCRLHLRGRTDCVWSHGSDFDIVIIKEALAKLGLATPWKFWNVEHTRSVYKLAGVKLPSAGLRTGGHHAFYDAVIQARYVQQSLQLIRSNSAVALLDKS